MADLHPSAIENFNTRAEALGAAIAAKQPRIATPTFRPQLHTSATITEADIIGEPTLGLIDNTGERVAVFFTHAGAQVGLEGKAFADLRRLAESMARRAEFRDSVSAKFFETALFEWVRDRHRGNETRTMCDVVIPKAQAVIKEHEIWVPVARFYVETPLPIGRVTLKTITPEFVTKWREHTLGHMKSADAESLRKAQEYFDRQRSRLQGLAAGVLRVTAEQERALELALTEVEDALSFLRLLTPANSEPLTVSHCVPLGKEREEGTEYFIFREERLIGRGEGFVRTPPRPWAIDRQVLENEPSRKLLAAMSHLLTRSPRNEFQKRLFSAIVLYSRNVLTADLAEKLMYILVPLESMFLKNQTEPIQQNLGERLAFFLSSDRQRRQEIVKEVRAAYELRSQFLHHGETIEDLETMRAFMQTAWHAMVNLLFQVNAFDTVQAFVDALDAVKFA